MALASYFITGTDTDVGKTMLTACLAGGFQSQGENITVMKPVQTGATLNADGSWSAPELDYTLRVLSVELEASDYSLHAPVCYEPPCSPHLAAAMAKRPVDLAKVKSAYEVLANSYDRVLVEGAGGLMVPLDEQWDMIDLIKALELPAILAVRPNLGTLNHSQLSADALEQAGIPLAGWAVVCTTADEWSFIEEDNVKTLKQRLHAPYLGTIPFIEGAEDAKRVKDRLAEVGTELADKL